MQEGASETRVLLFDEDEALLETTGRDLHRCGLAVTTVTTIDEALAALEGDAVDVIVLGVTAPRFGGVVLYWTIQRQWPGMPVVLIGGTDVAIHAIESARGSNTAQLSRPYSGEALAKVLERAVREARPLAPEGDQAPLGVLLVDAEEQLLETLSRRLRRRGMDVRTANDGVTALALLDERSCDVVVLDLRLPVMNGQEVLVALREQHPEVEVILLSGPQQPEQPTGEGRVELDVVAKPVDLRALVQRLQAAAERRRAKRLAGGE